MPLESRSLHLTRKIQNIDSEEKQNKQKNQVGRGPDDNTLSTMLDPISGQGYKDPNAQIDPNAGMDKNAQMNQNDKKDQSIVSNVTSTASGIFESIGSLVPGLGEKKNETPDPTNSDTSTPVTNDINEEQEPTKDINDDTDTTPEDETETETDKEDETKTLLSEGLDDVRKKYAEFYGVNEEDIIVDENGDDITKTGETTLLVGTDRQTTFSKNLKKGERVAVLFGITPGLKSGLLVYPDYNTVKSASTGKEMYNARVVFDKLIVPFDIKPGYSVKILVCYIETIAPVVQGEKLRLPYIPSISIVNYTTKETTTIDDEYEDYENNMDEQEDTFTGTLDDNLESTFTEESGNFEEEED